MIYISLGVDCGIATTLRKIGKRTYSLPFDWVVTYKGISEVVKNNFDDYLPNTSFPINKYFNLRYSILFVHNYFPRDNETMNKRSKRFLEILKSEKEKVIFIRKSHADHHHKEIVSLLNESQLCLPEGSNGIKNDIEDMIEFDLFLTTNYPNLNYEIHVILACTKCFNEYKTQNNIPPTIKIYNEASENPEQNISNDNYMLQFCSQIFK